MDEGYCPGCGGCTNCLRRDRYWEQDHGLPNGWWDDVETYWIGLFVLIFSLPLIAYLVG
jgi:hypothetical protein